MIPFSLSSPLDEQYKCDAT